MVLCRPAIAVLVLASRVLMLFRLRSALWSCTRCTAAAIVSALELFDPSAECSDHALLCRELFLERDHRQRRRGRLGVALMQERPEIVAADADPATAGADRGELASVNPVVDRLRHDPEHVCDLADGDVLAANRLVRHRLESNGTQSRRRTQWSIRDARASLPSVLITQSTRSFHPVCVNFTYFT